MSPLNRVIAVGLLLAAGAACAQDEPAEPPEPVQPRVVFDMRANYSQGTFTPDTAWLGLFCKGKRCDVKRAKVHIEAYSEQALDGDMTTLDGLKPEGAPVALFSNTTLAAGKVDSWYRPADTGDVALAYTSLRYLGRWAIPGGAVRLTISWIRLPDGKGYRYLLGDGKRKQFLLATPNKGDYGGDVFPVIMWVGDLDRDGKMDMLIDLPDDCRYDQRMYLSSLAKKGKFVGKAAGFAGSKSACG